LRVAAGRPGYEPHAAKFARPIRPEDLWRLDNSPRPLVLAAAGGAALIAILYLTILKRW
jgi:hypothetical protein